MRLIERTESGCDVSEFGKERGAALIVVLVILLLLSILGATMLDSTTSELKIAGNYRNSEEAFYAAEAALTFGMTHESIYTNLYGTTTTWPAPGAGRVLDENDFSVTADANDEEGHSNDYNQIKIPGTNNTADVKVEFVGTGNLPAGTGSQEDSGLSAGSGFKANNFTVSVIAFGPNNARVNIEYMAAKAIPQ